MGTTTVILRVSFDRRCHGDGLCKRLKCRNGCVTCCTSLMGNWNLFPHGRNCCTHPRNDSSFCGEPMKMGGWCAKVPHHGRGKNKGSTRDCNVIHSKMKLLHQSILYVPLFRQTIALLWQSARNGAPLKNPDSSPGNSRPTQTTRSSFRDQLSDWRSFAVSSSVDSSIALCWSFSLYRGILVQQEPKALIDN